MTRLRALTSGCPPLVLMALIFFFSAQPSLDSGLGLVDLIGRKLVHFAEYALLCFLWWRALRTRDAGARAALVALAIVARATRRPTSFTRPSSRAATARRSTGRSTARGPRPPRSCSCAAPRGAPHDAAAGCRSSRPGRSWSSPSTAPGCWRSRRCSAVVAARLPVRGPAGAGRWRAARCPGPSACSARPAQPRRGAPSRWWPRGDFACCSRVELVVPEAYGAVRFAALFLVAVARPLPGRAARARVALAGAIALLVIATAVRGDDAGRRGDLLGFYEIVFVHRRAGHRRAWWAGCARRSRPRRLRARSLSRRTIQAESEVRRRVAEAIHDGPVQELIGLDMMLVGRPRAPPSSGDDERGERAARARRASSPSATSGRCATRSSTSAPTPSRS